MAANLDVALNIQANVTGATNIEQINDALSDQRIAALQAASAAQDLSTAEGQAARIAIDAALASERQARALESQARAARAAANAAASVPNQTPAQQQAAAAANAHADALEEQARQARANATALGQQANAANATAAANTNAGNSAASASANIGKMAAVIGSVIAAAAGVGKLIEVADAFKLMESRVAILTEGMGDNNQAMQDIRAIANDVGNSLDAVAGVYGKVAQSAKELGLSQENVALFTQTLAKSFAVSGASAAEMDGALRQLAQALSSGVLRGDEFNSIMEQAPRIQQALADSLGVTKGELRAMAEEGKLSAELVTKALLEQSGAIEDEFGKVPDTVGKAWQAVGNELIRFVDIMNDGYGAMNDGKSATASLAEALRGLAGVFTDIQVFGIDTAEVFTDLAARFNYVIDILNTPIDGNTLDAVAERTRKLDIELANIASEYGVLRIEAIKAGEAGVKASADVDQSLQKPKVAADTLTQALKLTGDEASKAGEAIKKALSGIDVASTGGVLAITAAMRDAGANAKLLGDQITEWVNKANNADLSQFQQSVQAAFDAGALKADEFARYNDEILGASFKRLGLTAETELGRITPAINEGLQTLGTLSRALENSLDAPEAKMRALEAATAGLIDKAKNSTDIAALAANIERMGKAGELSAEGVKRATEALEAQRVEIAKGAGGVKSLEDQYKALGVTSIKALNDAAAAAASLYAQSVNAKAPIYEQAQAYTKLVQTQLAAAAAQGKAALAAKIAMFEATAATKEQRAEVERLKAEYEKKPAPVEIPAPDTTAFKAGINDAKSAVDGLIASVANAKNQTELREAQDQITAAFNEGTISSEEYTRALGAVDDQSRQLRQEIAAAATYLDGMTDSMKKATAAIWTGETSTKAINLQMQDLLATLQGGGLDSATADLEKQNVALRAQAEEARKAAYEWSHMFDITSRAGGADYVGAIVAQAKMSEIMAEQAIRANDLKIAQTRLADSIGVLKSQAEAGNIPLNDQLRSLQALEDQYGVLDDASLSALRSEIDAVNGKILSAIDSANALRDSLLQEQARARGDDATAVHLENARKIADIEKQIDEAKKMGNDEALRALQDALEIQKSLASEAEREARAKMEAAKQSSSTAPSANGGTIQTTRTESANKTSVDVTIKSDGAGLASLDRAALDSLARQLAPIIKQQTARGLN